MRATLRLHEQVQQEIELFEAKYHRTGFYPQYGNGGLHVTVYTEYLAPGTVWENYVSDLEAFLERNKEALSDITTMTIIGKSRYVA